MVEDIPQFDSLKNISDIRLLITNRIPESETMEYKAAKTPFEPKERDQIAKDVSAMANSSGGIVIYGVSTMESGKNKIFPDKLTYIHPGNAEVLDQVINSQIRPPIQGIQKKFLGKKRSHQVMVVYVPQSPESPHQSLVDKKYYRRSLTESLPMEHDLVALHFGKRHEPVLQMIKRQRGSESITFSKDDGFSGEISIELLISNKGKKVAKYTTAVVIFYQSSELVLVDAGRLKDISKLYPEENQKVFQFVMNEGVIHSNTELLIGTIRYKIKEDFLRAPTDAPIINWTLYAEGMTAKSGNIYFK